MRPEDVLKAADSRVRRFGLHPEQAPILKAGATQEEYEAFRAAEERYLERRDFFHEVNDDLLIDHEQRQQDYDVGIWGRPGYQEPYRKPDPSKIDDVAVMVVSGDIQSQIKGEPTLDDALISYLEHYREEKFDGNPRTIQSQVNNTKRLMSQFAAFIEGGSVSQGMQRLVTSVTVDDATGFRTWLRQQHPNSSTSEGYLRYPSAVFQSAIDRGQGLFINGNLMRNPFYKLRNKKREAKFSKKRWSLTPDEFHQI